MESKVCSRCKNRKPLTEFTIDVSRPDGHYVYCKMCLKSRGRQIRERSAKKEKMAHPERFDSLPRETFREIPGYDGRYLVSDMGRIKSLKTKGGVILRSRKTIHGYMTIMLSKKDVRKVYTIHSLVLSIFVSPRPEGFVVNHKDGKKDNNNLSNLEWVTQSENAIHSHEVLMNPYGTPPKHYGESHPQSKLTINDVKEIRRLYSTGRFPSRKLASMFGVSKVNILNIKNNKIWKGI